MTDFTTLELKVRDLKAKVANDSITPDYLGSLLNDFITQMKAIDMTGMSDDVRTAMNNAADALSNANSALTASGQATTAATNAGTVANSAYSMASQALADAATAMASAVSAVGTAETASNTVSALNTAFQNLLATVGSANGIAPLDANGRVPAVNLPGYVDDVVEFDSLVSGKTIQPGTIKSSTDPNCAVFFDTDTNQFVLGVVISLVPTLPSPEDEHGEIVNESTRRFAYYAEWADRSPRFEVTNDKIYVATSTNRQYRWSGSQLTVIGSDLALGETASTAYAGDKGKKNAEDIRDLRNLLESFSPLGNDFNVTIERLNSGEYRETEDGTTIYDTLETAIAYAKEKDVIAPGIHLTFAVADKSWKSYTYVGMNVNQANVDNESNWQDLAGLSAGDEPVININVICPNGGLNGFYSLGTALVALRDYEHRVGIVYRKKNLILTYRTADGESESKQFKGDSLAPTDFYNETRWKDFGKGSVDGIKVNGTPVVPDRDGTVNIVIPDPEVDDSLDESSTHPVQNAAIASELNARKNANITSIDVTGNDDDGYQIKTFNAKGEELDSIELPVGRGGGGESESGDTTKIVLSAQITDGVNPVNYLREGGTAILQYVFGHQYSTGDNAGQETGAYGTITITVKNGFTTTYEATLPGVTPGPYELDLTNILRTGNNSVTIQAEVFDPVANKPKRKQINPTVNVRRLSMSSSYDLQNSIKDGGYRPDETAVIPFSCAASGKKDIHVVIDGVEDLGKKLRDYSASTGEIRISMSGLSVGRHNVQIYATQTLPDLELQSETIFIDLLKRPIAGDNTEPYIGTKMVLPSGTVFLGSSWREPVVTTPQYAQMDFDFVVYDPDNVPAVVEVMHDGVTTQTISATRVSKGYANRFTQYGRDEMQLVCGSTVYNIHIDVTESRIDISEVSDSVIFKLNASGRTNSEQNPGQWGYEGISSSFYGFDWLDDGSGWNSGVLKLINGARLSILHALLAQNATTDGLTLEVEVRCTNIVDRHGTIMDCMGENGVGFRITSEEAFGRMDGGEEVHTNFAAGEWIRFAFTVERSSSARRLLSIYVDGRRDRAVKFDATSAMMNGKNSIDILSDAADVEVRMVNAFNRCLSDDEILNNFIAGQVNTDDMVVVFDRNNVLDADREDIDIEEMRRQGKGVLLIKGSEVDRLSDLNYRNDKSFQMRVDLEYYSPWGKEYDFRAKNALIQIQGTSSVTYPRKNYDIIFDAQTELWINGIKSTDNLYSFKPGARPVSIWCLKADFCDSSGTHNTGACRTINDLFKRCGWLTPPQTAYAGAYDVRVGIDGFPITLYNDDDGSGTSVFIGKYNFNNEKKGSGIVYGFEGIDGFNDESTLAGRPNPCICLEFLENGQPLGLFQNADFDRVVDAKGTCAFDKALEFRFPTRPDGSKLKWANASDYQKTAIRRLWNWVVGCIGNPTKFLTEYNQYFGNDAPFAQYALTDYFMGVDGRVKNVMLVTWDGIIWYFIPYDWDCLFGLDNTSHLKYDYDIDENTWDEALSNYAFAGHDSEMWKLVRACPQKLSEVAAKIRANLSVTAVKAAFSTDFEAAWAERVYNKDEEYKYIYPAFVDVERDGDEVYDDYLFALQGSRKSHRNYIIDNRFALLDSLYGIGDFRGNAQKIYLFGEFATDPRNIKIKAFEKFGFGYGSNNSDLSGKVVASSQGEEVTLTVNTNLSANDPQNIYGADRIEGLDLTDIADKIVSTLTLSACKRLRDLDLTNDGNDALEQLDVSGCRILRSAKVNGLRAVRALDLSKNRKLETLEADETNVSVVNFATGAVTTKAALPATIQSLVLVGLPNLTLGADGLSASDWSNMVSLQAEQLGSMNPVALLRLIVNAQNHPDHRPLQRVKIGGASTRGDGSELLALIERGVVGISNSTKPEVNGIYQLDALINAEDFDRIEQGIDGITLVVVIEAYINAINEVNGEMYAGMEEVENVTVDNVAELALRYYNGETYEEWLERYAQENANINSITE